MTERLGQAAVVEVIQVSPGPSGLLGTGTEGLNEKGDFCI